MQAIEAARSFLIDRYREILDTTFDFATNYDVDRPGWIWVDEDLDPRGTAGDHALVLDPEVGIALFLIRFQAYVDERPGTNVRAQVARGVGLRSRLLPRRLPALEGDVRGSWRVLIHWFVDQADAASWGKQVSDLRRDTAHLDELPVDAIVGSYGDWSAAVQRHAFPRLLLKTRGVLRIASAEALVEWSSADAQVARELHGFGHSFKGDLERKLAGTVEDCHGIGSHERFHQEWIRMAFRFVSPACPSAGSETCANWICISTRPPLGALSFMARMGLESQTCSRPWNWHSLAHRSGRATSLRIRT